MSANAASDGAVEAAAQQFGDVESTNRVKLSEMLLRPARDKYPEPDYLRNPNKSAESDA